MCKKTQVLPKKALNTNKVYNQNKHSNPHRRKLYKVSNKA